MRGVSRAQQRRCRSTEHSIGRPPLPPLHTHKRIRAKRRDGKAREDEKSKKDLDAMEAVFQIGPWAPSAVCVSLFDSTTMDEKEISLRTHTSQMPPTHPYEMND